MSKPSDTKKEFATALRLLLKTASFSDIRVGAICELCGKNRKSFYYHFKDKYDLCGWILQSELMSAILEKKDADSEETDIFAEACRYFYQNRVFYRKLMQVDGQNSFREYFCDILGEFLTLPLSPFMPKGTNSAFCTRFCAEALASSLRHWLDAGAPLPPEEFAVQMKNAVFTIAGAAALFRPES